MYEKFLDIVLIHLHGLFRSHDLELGRDADTGGQTKYVLEYAQALGEHPAVKQVTVLHRLIADPKVSSDYAQEREQLSDRVDIVRIRCGGSRYIRKEKLWPYLDEFVDNTIEYFKREGRHPDILHSHYADAGYLALQLSKFLNIPFIHTGHSLGRSKKQKLLQSGMSEKAIDATYRIDHRIEVEEEIIRKALFIVTSTKQEIEEQYQQYKSADSGTFVVNPPGIDLDRFFPYYYLDAGTCHMLEKFDRVLMARDSIKNELNRFFVNSEKQIILTVCRPEMRKNIEGLITAYGRDRELQHIANLAIFAGIRKDLTDKDKPENKILIDMLLLMDKYDLYGKLAIPKKHDFEHEIPELYRYVADRKGVFVNSAFHEPFGLTLLEAAASGLPIVSTDNGGPRDIVESCQNGLLVDVSEPRNISQAIKSILVEDDAWQKFSRNGIQNVATHYSWKAHARLLVETMAEHQLLSIDAVESRKEESIQRVMTAFETLLITDIDNTLIGDDEHLAVFLDFLARHRRKLGFGVATGRDIESAMGVLQMKQVPMPQILITSVGTEIYYYVDAPVRDNGWETHIKRFWEPDRIREIAAGFPWLTAQSDQRTYKISYIITEHSEQNIMELKAALKSNKLHFNLVVSEFRLLDIIPFRASKYDAIQYLLKKWNLTENRTIVAGDSGNDREMLVKMPNAVIVANHQPELRTVKKAYLSPENNAAALIDGIRHFNLLPERT